MNKRINNKQPQEEQFQAYGEYTYLYQYEDAVPETPPTEVMNTAPQPLLDNQPQQQKKKPRKSGSVFFRVFALLTLLTIGILVMLQTVFRVEAVRVTGHSSHTAQEVVNASGLTYGQSIFSVKAEDVSRHMEKDHSLIFKGLQVKYPNMVYLQVEEREPVSLMQWLGVHYVLDPDGLVMAETTGTELIGKLPVVTGIRVSSAHKGQFLVVKSQKQLDAYRELIKELNLQGYASQVTEIRLNNPENIYLVTAEGISVRIGKPENLMRKVRSVRTAVAYLRSLGEDDGVLDVCEPTDLKYRSGK